MKTFDRIPRNLLRVHVRELQPGEGTWVHGYDLHICENGRVFVDLSQSIWPRAYDEWSREAQKDSFFIERIEDGWRLHILSRDHISPSSRVMTAEERERYAAVTEVVVHADEDEVCPCCQGAGIVNMTGKNIGAYRNVPFETMRRVEKALDHLEGIYGQPLVSREE